MRKHITRETRRREATAGFLSVPTLEEIQMRAYEIYLERAGRPGNAMGDWLQAEHELINRARAAQGLEVGSNGVYHDELST
ncbi:MAG: DUF2934 domain-containing protein [Phycisphaerales bacterium]|nr:DUF2934 domain-containing protein [Phycisphaerales bacterium]